MISDMFEDGIKEEKVSEETKIKKLSPFDIIGSVNSGNAIEFEDSEYVSFIINRGFSYFPDTILYANMMNKAHFLDPKIQYSFYLNTVRPRKRFSAWLKREKNEDLEFIMNHYGYDTRKAQEALKILTDSQLKEMREKKNKGGFK
jgi:hypothetical protein